MLIPPTVPKEVLDSVRAEGVRINQERTRANFDITLESDEVIRAKALLYTGLTRSRAMTAISIAFQKKEISVNEAVNRVVAIKKYLNQ
jgi:hypothetical protein